MIDGEAGIGKTRLVFEVITRRSKSHELHFLRGRCKYHQGLDPYSPFIEALRNWFGLTEQDSDVDEKDKIGQIIRRASPELIGIVPLIRGFLSAGTSIYGSYLFKGSNIGKSFQTLKELVQQEKMGLCITREHPDIIKEHYELTNTEIYWLTRSGTEFPSVDPSKIEKLRWIIKDFVNKNKNSVVLIDGLEYLILQNNFNSVLKFIELLKDDVALNDAVLLLPINPDTLEPQQIALLERYTRVISSDTSESTLQPELNTSNLSLPAQLDKCYPPRATDMDYIAEKDKMFQAILQLINNITSHNPLVLFLDDLHWADYSSIQLLQYLFQNSLNNKIVIIGSYRPEDIPEGENLILEMMNNLKRQNLTDKIHKLTLDRLARNHISTLLKNIFDEHVPEKFINLIFLKSEGNPLYAEEILKSLLEDNLIDITDKTWYKKIDYSSIEIPNSINEVVRMRIDRFTKGNDLIDQILKYTAIIGSTFNFNILLSAIKLDEEVLLDHIERLMKANIIHEINVDEYKFDHTLIREVIYNDLGARRKKLLHAKIGSSIEHLYKNNLTEYYAKLAYHYSKGGVFDKAIYYSLKEGEVAKELCAYDESIFHYRSALEMINENKQVSIDSDQQIELQLNLGDLSMILGAWNDAKGYLEKSLELCNEFGYDQQKVESTSKLSQIDVKRQKWSVAVKKLEDVLGLKLDDKQTNNLLVTINPKYVIRANISLIEILLKENLRGIYICINHPSYLVDKLLHTHQIPTQNLSYLDFIPPIIDVLPETGETIYGIDTAYSMGSIIDAINLDTEEFFKQVNFDLADIDFIMVDNISNLTTFATADKISRFIETLTQMIKKSELAYGIVIMDNKTDSAISKAINRFFDKAIPIKEV
jgi:predicted ATPase